ncbi:MAG: PocR ligand-binding domain-containing protein, partial [Kiritimatiellales bacterium]
KRMQEAIEKRILALTRPLGDPKSITFDDLFDLKEIQRIQDEFATATGVSSIITWPDGTPITQPSNYSRLCRDIIQKTEKGCTNCFKSYAELGRLYHPKGPIVETCVSGGLWVAGVTITIGDRYLANWQIGQVRDETQTEEDMRAYAREIGADEKTFIKAFREVPVMSREHFEQIAQALFTLASQLSTSAYQNIQQARFIAEEKKNQAELTRLSTAIEQASEVIMVTDTAGIIQYGNPAFETISGYSREEALGKSTQILESGKHDAAFFYNLWQTISSGKTWEGRFINKRKNGELYTEDAVISPVRDPSGIITGHVAVKRDITKELVQEEQYRQSQKMDAIGQLTGGIAHDFNNILQAVLGFSEILLKRLNKDSMEHQDALEIQKAAKRAAEMTRQLLAFSRKQSVELKRIDLNATVRDTEVLLRLLLGDRTKLTFVPHPALHEIYADHSQLTQILMNLALNARDAMPDGGHLTITTENAAFGPQAAAEIPEAEPGSFVCLSVADTGCGMSREVKDHLFEPFFTTKEVGHGTGLGLSVVYGIVKQSKGWIHVDSEEGRGTTLKIY